MFICFTAVRTNIKVFFQTDVIAENPSKKVKLPKYDLLLKRFQYCEAFDYILKVCLENFMLCK